MKSLGADMKVFTVLTVPLLYHNLKSAIKEIVTGDKHPDTFYHINPYGAKHMVKIVTEKNWNDLPEHARKAAADAYNSFAQSRDGQLCDIIVDKASLDAIKKTGEESGEKVVRDYAETTVAVTDIKIAVRCVKTGKSVDFAKMALAKCDTLDVDTLAKAVGGGMEKVVEYIKRSNYKEAAEALAESPSDFECWVDNKMIRTMKPQKTNPFTIGPLFAYVIARQNEIKTVRIVMTGKENGLDADSIRQRVREMYG